MCVCMCVSVGVCICGSVCRLAAMIWVRVGGGEGMWVGHRVDGKAVCMRIRFDTASRKEEGECRLCA